jgi:pSer/pThr/pTyr-binding forkhead associated (FHA) protein
LDNQYEDFEPPKAITAPPAKLSTRVEDEETPNLSFTSQRLYMVFVNTPAQSLVKSRVAIEFDVFPVISIGRNPENVVVVPDQEVSRKHARLSLEGGKVILKDLQSANGTFVYDGKQFQRVNGSVEIKPNTILKFGSGTIVRLINE